MEGAVGSAEPQSVQARVLSVEAASVELRRDLDLLERWVNHLERRIISVNQECQRIRQLERQVRHLTRANVLLLRALGECQRNYQLLARRVSVLESAAP